MKRFFRRSIKLFLVILLITNNLVSDGYVAYAASKQLPAFILLTKYSKSMNIGDEYYICAIPSNGSFPKWTSSNSRVASVNTYGVVTAKKAGKAKIKAKISGAEASCTITVKKTTVQLNKSSVSLEHGETFQLNIRTSSDSDVTFRSKRPSVASVTDDGVILGEKPGSTTITVMADSTKKTCKVKVKKPTIKLNKTKLTLQLDKECNIKATTSSGLDVTWKSKKPSIADVDDEGNVYANKIGTTRIYASLDGVKKYCSVKVTK